MQNQAIFWQNHLLLAKLFLFSKPKCTNRQ